MYILKILRRFLLFVSGFSVTLGSCSHSSDVSFELETNNGSLRKDNLRVLCIGNSYSCDALAYMPIVLQNSRPDMKLTLGILCRGGCDLCKHWLYRMQWPQWAIDDGVYYYEWDGNSWNELRSATGTDVSLDVLLAKEWDVIILQEVSTKSIISTESIPYLKWSSSTSLPKWIRGHGFNGEFIWLLTPSYPDGYSFYDRASDYYVGNNYDSPEKMDAGIAFATKQIMALTDDDGKPIFSGVIPAGTAIANLRHTALDAYGDFGHLSYDGRHQQEGAPRLVEAYTAVIVLAGRDVVSDDHTEITTSWLDSHFIPGRNGNPVGMSDADRELVKWAAIAAVDNPYSVTLPTTNK